MAISASVHIHSAQTKDTQHVIGETSALREMAAHPGTHSIVSI